MEAPVPNEGSQVGCTCAVLESIRSSFARQQFICLELPAEGQARMGIMQPYKFRDERMKELTYGLSRSASRDPFHKSRRFPWMKKNKRYEELTPIVCLQEEINDFFEYILPTKAEQLMREEVVERMKQVIKLLWPQAKVEVYGSFATSLYLPTSAIDIVVLGELPNPPFWVLASKLEKVITGGDIVTVLDSASVPIVKLVDKKTGVKVNVSFNQFNGVQSTKVIKDFLLKFPKLKYMVMVLKQFLLESDLNKAFTGGISSYCLFCLVVSFLQLQLPPKDKSLNPDENLAILLIKFFEFYGRIFNYHEFGIRITGEGCYVPKKPVMNKYKGFLYIEDPVNPENNIGKTTYAAGKAMQAFEEAFIVLSQCTCPCKQNKYDSVLGNILRMTDEGREYRNWVALNFAQPHPARQGNIKEAPRKDRQKPLPNRKCPAQPRSKKSLTQDDVPAAFSSISLKGGK